jgi:phosphoribosyl 1,2-cyclic phosphate phosphodiesterase
MKIKILGTAAYERVPAMFCQCAVCEQARKLKGKNMRTQAQTLIDNELLVDFGQDNYIHYLSSGADYTKIKNICWR